MLIISRCLYCRQKDSTDKVNVSVLINGETKQIETISCSEECKNKINEFVDFNNVSSKNFIKIGIAGLVLFLFLTVIKMAGINLELLPYMMIFLGAVFLLYPLATWGVYKRIGIKYATLIIRILAVLLIGLGVLRLI